MSHYTYKFRLYPNDKQKIQLAKSFGTCRFIHNYFLEKRNKDYLDNKKTSNYYADCAELTKLKKQYIWMKEVYSQSLQQELNHLATAFNRFFKKVANFPRFHSKHHKQSFRIPQNIKIENELLVIPKFKEGIKFRQHRKIEGTIKHATISKNKAEQYFVCICAERGMPKLPKNNKEIGIDLGVKSLACCSDGKTYPNIKPYKTLETRIRLLQQAVSRKTNKESKKRRQAKVELARKHNRIVNIRNNNLHQITRRIINENQVVVMEDLNVSGMLRNHCLAKSIQDVSLYELKRQLTYKAEWYGRSLITIDRWYPSSKMHNKCGFINQNLTLKDREWLCPRCNEMVDRDFNASINILNEGKRTSGTEGIGYRPDVRLEDNKLKQLVG